MIPEILKQKGIRFVLLERSGKKPFQPEWQNKVIEFDNPELIEHLNRGGNYGILGGGEKFLIILDFDDENIQDLIVPKLPKTFTIKTGSGKLHKYFFSDGKESFKVFNENMDTLIDVQGEGKQVVGANSTHPNGNKYEVIDNSPIAFISYSEIKALLSPFDKKPKKQVKEYQKPRVELTDDFIEAVKSRVSIKDVLDSFGINTTKNPTECPFHESKGGKCLGYNYETAHCFHCDGSWNIFSLVKEMKNCSFKEALEYLANMCGLSEELEMSRTRYLQSLKESQEGEKKDLKLEFLSLVKEKNYNKASELIVDYIKKNYYIYTTKDDEKSEMWVYDNGIYNPNGKSYVKKIMRDVLGNCFNAYNYNQVMNKLEPDTYIPSDKFFNQIHTYEIPVKNGILNILTRELKEFTPDKIFFNKLPVEYNPSADCPAIEKFLKDVLAKEDDVDLFYEIGGFCLLKEYKFEKAFMFVGNGRNGKDKSLELLKRLVGSENCCAVPLSSIIPDSFIISEFFGKMVNIAGDISNQELKETGTLKALTGRSILSAQRKFLNAITFQNYAKFIFACNDLPIVYDGSLGFWDRWILLEFPYTFVTKEVLEKEKNTMFKLRDEDIIEKIATENSMSGFLNKCLDGLDRILLQRGFSTTLGSNEVKTLWVRKSNSVAAFCVDMVKEDYDSFITKKDFRKKYSEYCKKYKLQQKSDYIIKRTLEENYGVTPSERNTLILGFERVWEGVKWKEN